MIPCNKFLDENREVLSRYFENLVKVDDLDTELVLDQFLEHTSKRNTQIQISFNQIFLLHSLLERHIDLVCTSSPDDPSFKKVNTDTHIYAYTHTEASRCDASGQRPAQAH